MAQDNSATGGLLVVLGILVAIGLGLLFFKSGVFGSHSSGTEIKVEMPKVDAPQ